MQPIATPLPGADYTPFPNVEARNGLHAQPVAQHLAHPLRSFARVLRWPATPTLRRERAAVLWASRRKAR